MIQIKGIFKRHRERETQAVQPTFGREKAAAAKDHSTLVLATVRGRDQVIRALPALAPRRESLR